MSDFSGQKRAKLRRAQEQEYGDWRVPLKNPREAEHLKPIPVSVIRRVDRKMASLLTSPPSYYADEQEWNDPLPLWQVYIRRVIGLCVLLPISIVMVYALMVQLYHAAPVVGNFDFWQSVPVWFSILGALVFLTVKYFRLIDTTLVYIYVLGHELTHAIAALMCFGKVQALSVRVDGGYVDTDTDNLFVSLSPYFVPLWMLVWLGVFYVANWIHPFEYYSEWFYSGFGFWWAFHVYWTLWVIPREQPDLLENGIIFSFMIILLANIVALLLMLRCFGVISLAGYYEDFKICAVEIYITYRDLAVWILQYI